MQQWRLLFVIGIANNNILKSSSKQYLSERMGLLWNFAQEVQIQVCLNRVHRCRMGTHTIYRGFKFSIGINKKKNHKTLHLKN